MPFAYAVHLDSLDRGIRIDGNGKIDRSNCINELDDEGKRNCILETQRAEVWEASGVIISGNNGHSPHPAQQHWCRGITPQEPSVSNHDASTYFDRSLLARPNRSTTVTSHSDHFEKDHSGFAP